jgi:hypothetical protein
MQLCVTASQPGSSENGDLISKACLHSSNRISGGRRKRGELCKSIRKFAFSRSTVFNIRIR